MSHRTQGQTKDCKGCRFWSEMLAKADRTTCGEVHAMCLNNESPKAMKYTGNYFRCDNWKSGHLGAIDEPGMPADAYEGEPDEAP